MGRRSEGPGVRVNPMKEQRIRACCPVGYACVAGQRGEGIPTQDSGMLHCRTGIGSQVRGGAFTRYFRHQYSMVKGIHKGGRWGGVYCALVVQ